MLHQLADSQPAQNTSHEADLPENFLLTAVTNSAETLSPRAVFDHAKPLARLPHLGPSIGLDLSVGESLAYRP